MRKFNFICSIIVTITLPLMIVIISSNIALRTSSMYKYHFNDSQVIDEVPYDISGAYVAGRVSSYWWSMDSGSIQLYEDNGIYKDPVLNATEQKVMKKAKVVMDIELGIGFICLALTLAVYGYFCKKNFKAVLRKRIWAGTGITVILFIAQAVCWCIKSIRIWAYDTFIGIKLAKDSTLAILLGDPLYVTYVLYTTILGTALLAVIIYANHHITKPPRIFY